MGEPVKLRGLEVHADLNGTLGFAVGWVESMQRYSVVVKTKSVSPMR